MAGRRHAVEDTVDSTRQGSLKTEPGRDPGAAARLVGVYPPDLQLTVDLDEHPAVLGRAPDDPTTPPIVHKTVSRSHFRIEWDARSGRHVGCDLDSRNGSEVDARTMRGGWRQLEPGSVLRLGDVLLVYESGRTLDVVDPAEVSREAAPGDAQAIRRLRAHLARAAPDISPALIIGETGTGKERVAAELHRLSGRKGEFVAVNCATFGEQLIESQLFGHVKGAFTGATSDQPGLFRAAEGGTLFLDEIGEMPLELQPKLLRAIQEREVRPLGGARSLTVDVRIVAATHRKLAQKARAGEFRQDLFARLALWQLDLPALRERRSDLLFWVKRLHHIWADSRGVELEPIRFSSRAAQAVLLSPWLENLRGLDRFVHDVAALGSVSEALTRDQLPTWIHEGATP